MEILNNPEPNELNTAEQAPVPLSSARFLDPLEPQHEQLWQNIHSSAKATHNRCEDLLLPLGFDDSIPQAIRDRALLVGLALWTPVYENERRGWTRSMSFFGSGSIASINDQLPNFDIQAFAEWGQALYRHQLATGQELIAPARAFNWFCELYNESIIDDEKLDELIETVPPQDRRLILKHQLDDMSWGGDHSYVKRPGTFSIVAEGLSPDSLFKPDSRLTTWSKQKLTDWLDVQNGAKKQLPEWLASVDDEAGKELFSTLARFREKELFVGWDFIRQGIRRYGLSILYRDHHEALRLSGYDIDDAEIKHDLVIEVMENRATERQQGIKRQALLSAGYLALSEAIAAQDPVNERLAALNATERSLIETENAKRELEASERQAKRQKELLQDPEYLKQQDALETFHALVETSRSLV